MTRYDWCEAFVRLKDRPLSFDDRPYLRAVYNTTARRVVLRCSRQVEKTTYISNVVAHAAATIPGVRIVVVFPRQEQAMVFAKSRLLPLITESPIIRRLLLGSKPRQPQVTHMRFVNRAEVYIRAAYHSADAVRGIDADYLLIDEYQDIAGGDLPVLEETLSHSEHRRVILTGTPKTIDNHWKTPSTARRPTSGARRARAASWCSQTRSAWAPPGRSVPDAKPLWTSAAGAGYRAMPARPGATASR